MKLKTVQTKLKCLTIANDICKSRNKPYGISEILAEVEHIQKAIEPVIEQGAFEQVIGKALFSSEAEQDAYNANTEQARRNYPTKL